MDSARYEGKPLLRLLELYVLWASDTLADEDEARLFAMAPKLSETFGGDGSWQSAIATAMQFPSNMPQLVAEKWTQNRAMAKAQGVDLPPQQFAEAFVDTNFTG